MLKIFCPDFRFDSIASIPVEWLKKQQVERVILDVDNTLLPRDEVQLDADVLNWLELLRKNEIEIVLLSNNGGERLRKIREDAQIEAVSWAVKPMPWGSWLTASDNCSLDSKRWLPGARVLPWLTNTSSLKVS